MRRHRRRRDASAIRERLALERAGRVHRFRQPEVEHLHRAVGADLDVRGLQIAMDDALLVRGFERLGDLLRDRQRFVEWNRAARDALRQVLALDEFHHQGGDVRRFLEAVDRRDVRMVEGREDFGFALKAREAIGIAGHRGGQHLDRDRPLQIRVGRAIDLAHAAGADLRGDFVDAEAGAGGKGQGCAGLYVGSAVARNRSCSDAVVASDAVHTRPSRSRLPTRKPPAVPYHAHAGAWDPYRIARRMPGWVSPCRRSDSVNGLGVGTEGGASSVSVFVR